ncbi:MAG TPA: TlpA disulfide reductase family protein [Mariprofundaceae bacterium]|nr:TlpA disulfide reductase family protein [Mariprofundaceae bacterium]
MKYRFPIAVLVLLALGAGLYFSLPEPPAQVKEGNPAVDFSLPDLAGAIHTLPKGEVTLLNFWATWCPPCRKEMPSMISLHEKLAARGLKLVAVSVDKSSSDLASFVHEFQIPFQVLHDADSTISRRYGVFRYPETFLIDRNGVIRHHLVGGVDWMSKPVLDIVEGMLNEPANREPVRAGS